MLALWAKMCSPTGQNNAPDRRFTPTAGFAGPQVYAVFELEEPTHTVGIHIIGNRRPAQSDRVMENLAQGQAQPFKLRSRESSGGPPGSETGMKQALICVDIAHPGQKRLVQQRRLYRQSPASKQRRKLFRADSERVLAGRSK